MMGALHSVVYIWTYIRDTRSNLTHIPLLTLSSVQLPPTQPLLQTPLALSTPPFASHQVHALLHSPLENEFSLQYTSQNPQPTFITLTTANAVKLRV